MSFLRSVLTSLILISVVVSASPAYNARPFDSFLSRRQSSNSSSTSVPVVDLGYERYQGVGNATLGQNKFLGIRYAASPTGSLRFQAPSAPKVNRDEVLPANTLPARCPQSPSAPITPGFNYNGTEDCLFLSVYAPQNAENLPVLVWIHGGGYGQGQGDQDLSMIISTNNNSFIGVAIQYRLGAFGFLSSDEVNRYGVLNPGIRDQTFALQWVQSYISLFGGNASQVTISGDSAGAGSVMLQGMAFGGNLGDSLFVNSIAASPYLPQQFGYADFVPTQSYYAFASAAGCFTGLPQANVTDSIFNCLVGKDTDTLQNASAYISGSGRYGTWGFVPVTDGSYIQQLPSQQLLTKQINGKRILSGNNANEGPLFTPQTISTESDFIAYLRNTFPLFTPDDISRILLYYPSPNASTPSEPSTFATSGTDISATALNQSTFSSGQQQRANNIYAETTFVCPSYWLAEAYTGDERVAYKYQYSPIFSQHGADINSYFGPPVPYLGEDFTKAVMTIWGNFITNNDPSITVSIAAGSSSSSSSSTNSSDAASENLLPADPEAVAAWPPYTLSAPYQLNLNQSGGVPLEDVNPYPGLQSGLDNITVFTNPGLRNDFQIVNAYTWEGERGVRCDFWRSVARIVPE